MAEYLPEPLVPARLPPFYELLLRLGLWRSATPRSLLHIGRTGVRGWHHPSSLGLLACYRLSVLATRIGPACVALRADLTGLGAAELPGASLLSIASHSRSSASWRAAMASSRSCSAFCRLARSIDVASLNRP